ncbi:hypothetical protein K525DRAFT_149414, partial [Schizophyllum commune Loenen D]
ALRQLRKMHLIADLKKIKPAAYVFSPGAPRRYVVDKEEQRATVLEADSTLHIRYRILGGGPSASTTTASRRNRYDPLAFRPCDQFKAKDARFWQPVSYDKWFCTACEVEILRKNVGRHAKNASHQHAVAQRLGTGEHPSFPRFEGPAAPMFEPHVDEATRQVVYQRIQQLLLDRAHEAQSGGWSTDPNSGMANMDWEADAWRGTEESYVPHNEDEVGALAEDLLDHLETGQEGDEREMPDLVDSDDEEEERDDENEGDGDEGDESEEDGDDGGHGTDDIPQPAHSRQRRCRVFDNEQNPWYPWPDKETCVVDILRHVPRCAFSRKQNQVIHWAMAALGIDDAPSDRTMQDIDKKLQSICGVHSIRFVSAFSNIYYANDIPALIAQEVANPRVRRHLHFLPEKVHGRVSEAWQASRWLDELDPDFLTQNIRKRDDPTQEFFIYEPALLRNGSVVMPVRWYIDNNTIYAKGWNMSPDPLKRGWIVEEHSEVVFSEHDLDLSLPLFAERHGIYRMPSPRVIYNVHFMTTSNIVSPLEMAEGVVAQIKEAQEHGIWAYDAKEHDYVLLIPSIFALLGDNPMQSELCCHSGMAANHFCRICWVEGTGMEDDDEGDAAEPQHPSHMTSTYTAESRPTSPSSAASRASTPASPTSTISPSSSPGPAVPSRTPASGARTRLAETFEGMAARLECFMSVGHRLRTKSETLGILMEQFNHAKRVGGKKALKASRTMTGIRDAYQDRFLAQLTEVTTKKSRRKVQKEADVASLLATFPNAARLMNPLCRLKELDAHSDTPVEILHVVLLGFVKYFWRDVIAHRLGKAEKLTLKARLNSFDTRGLGIPPLSGDVLVDHAGSLVGRDFRAIAQVAPFVLHDLGIEDSMIRVWMALSKVIPLVWQPEIDDLDEYLVRLQDALRYLLDCTCQFDAQWFNKPKFHIVLHLPDHIRRFGPAMLFATEGFESFNAVVRAHSVHSNRHAPSRDIARSMARSNRIRHLISGGYFRVPSEQDLSTNGFVEEGQSISPWMRQVRPTSATHWRSVGKLPQSLVTRGKFAFEFLSLPDE